MGGEIKDDRLTVIYDYNCFICRNLAEFIQKKLPTEDIFFTPHSQFIQKEALELSKELSKELAKNELHVFYSGRVYSQEAGWLLLLERHPSLSTLSWLAQKLGIKNTTTAKILKNTGRGLRTFCYRCF